MPHLDLTQQVDDSSSISSSSVPSLFGSWWSLRGARYDPTQQQPDDSSTIGSISSLSTRSRWLGSRSRHNPSQQHPDDSSSLNSVISWISSSMGSIAGRIRYIYWQQHPHDGSITNSSVLDSTSSISVSVSEISDSETEVSPDFVGYETTTTDHEPFSHTEPRQQIPTTEMISNQNFIDPSLPSASGANKPGRNNQNEGNEPSQTHRVRKRLNTDLQRSTKDSYKNLSTGIHNLQNHLTNMEELLGAMKTVIKMRERLGIHIPMLTEDLFSYLTALQFILLFADMCIVRTHTLLDDSTLGNETHIFLLRFACRIVALCNLMQIFIVSTNRWHYLKPLILLGLNHILFIVFEIVLIFWEMNRISRALYLVYIWLPYIALVSSFLHTIFRPGPLFYVIIAAGVLQALPLKSELFQHLY